MERTTNIPMFGWTGYCPECRQASMYGRSGRACAWCDTKMEPITLAEKGPVARLSPQALVQLHGYCTFEGIALTPALAGVWKRLGYRSAAAAYSAVIKSWSAMGLPPLPNRAGTKTGLPPGDTSLTFPCLDPLGDPHE